MNKKLIIATLLALLSITATAQLINGKYIPEPFLGQNGKYGYVIYKDRENEVGKDRIEIIGAQFDAAFGFVQISRELHLARIKQVDKYGFVTTTGVPFIKPKFEEADDFHKEGFCKVMLEGKYGIIDYKGNFSVSNKFDAMNDLFNGWFEVSQNDAWGYVYHTGIYVQTQEAYYKKIKDGFVVK